MKKHLILLPLLLVVLAGPTLAQDVNETIGTGIKPAIAVDEDGHVHLAYLTEEMVGGVFYATNASGEWETTQISEGYFYGPVDIALGPDGTPYIAYHDHQDTRFEAEKGDEVVVYPEDGDWQLLTVSHPGHDGWDNSIVVDSEGFWHTASIDPAQFRSQDGVEYATNAYGGGVSVEQIGSGPQPYEFATSIDVRTDGTVGVAYFNAEPQDLMYARRTPGEDGTWTVETVDSEGDVGRYAALKFDADGSPHITYWRNDGQEAGVVRYAWQAEDGSWQTEDVGELTKVPQGHVGARKITALDFDSTGNLHVVYGDRLQIVHAQRDADGQWTHRTVAQSETDSGNLGAQVEFDLGPDDRPHITYLLVSGFNPLTGDVIYTTTEE